MKMQRKQQPRQTPPFVRCAMYTRKNHDIGEPDEVNYVPTQRKKIRAFIAARRRHGWVRVSEAYEDVGYSACDFKRPALKRLLSDMKAGKVDCVVIHTLDRLVRRPADKERLFATFQRCGVALVIVDPPFFLVKGKMTTDILPMLPDFPYAKRILHDDDWDRRRGKTPRAGNAR